ncbi:hypothetical protein H4K35_10150 [Myroides sp. NP-2]|uniref:hypothetical protein n=1 Tax=Myroides sp. NP-2 TaxID=2759945 RepID=UPI0015FB0127|nr:hypothetical protein [Myroides sp. NP-2]MBB1150473.1 hypothetical protein [Myroides sp. NP-2]
MKKLMLMGALLLSVGAFAQKPIEPPIYDPVKCTLDLEFVTRCIGDPSRLSGTYIIQICSTSVGKVPHERIFEWIQDYYCENNTFPSYVTVKRFIPGFTPYQ